MNEYLRSIIENIASLKDYELSYLANAVKAEKSRRSMEKAK